MLIDLDGLVMARILSRLITVRDPGAIHPIRRLYKLYLQNNLLSW